jgi:hypothetical protein
MARDDTDTQYPLKITRPDGLSARGDTKRGFGMWRGRVIHPDEPDMGEIIASGEPVTDCKGLGLRYTPVRAKGRIPHFRVQDAEFSAALNSAYPAFHHAAVRVLAVYLQQHRYAGLKRLVRAGDLPPTAFRVGSVRTEVTFCVDGVTYRPDIVVESHDAGYPRIELEVVNTHPPAAERVEAAERDNALVLWMNIRDLVERCVFDSSTTLGVPADPDLLEMLLPKWFTSGLSVRSEAIRFQVLWRDLDQARYLERLADGVEGNEHRIDSVLAEVEDESALLSAYVRDDRIEDAVRYCGYDSVLKEMCEQDVSPGLAEAAVTYAVLRKAGFWQPEGGVWQLRLSDEVAEVLEDYDRATDVSHTVAPALNRLRGVVETCDARTGDCVRVGQALYKVYREVAARWKTAHAARLERERAEAEARRAERERQDAKRAAEVAAQRKAARREAALAAWTAKQKEQEDSRGHKALLRAEASKLSERGIERLNAAQQAGEDTKALRVLAQTLLDELRELHPHPETLNPPCPILPWFLRLCKNYKAR